MQGMCLHDLDDFRRVHLQEVLSSISPHRQPCKCQHGNGSNCNASDWPTCTSVNNISQSFHESELIRAPLYAIYLETKFLLMNV